MASRTRSTTTGPATENWLLLRAALGSGSEALAAWTRWKTTVDVDRLDDRSRRLLPLLGENLRRLGVRDPLLARFAVMRHLVQASNRARFEEAAEILRALHAASIDTLVLKGMAVATLYYGDPGLRPMVDVDVLVPVARRREAIAVLERAGWRRQWTVPDTTLAVIHSMPFRGPGGREMDLHWHALMECCDERADDDFWADAAPLTIAGVATRTLSPADLLLHACVHGIRSPFSWIADAAVLLRSATIDWDRLVAQARAREVVLPVTDALAVLSDVAQAPVPHAVMERLRGTPSSAFLRIEHGVRLRGRGLGGTLPGHLCLHWRRHRHAGPLRAIARLPRYLQYTYGLSRLRDLPATLASKSRRQLGRHLTGAVER